MVLAASVEAKWKLMFQVETMHWISKERGETGLIADRWYQVRDGVMGRWTSIGKSQWQGDGRDRG